MNAFFRLSSLVLAAVTASAVAQEQRSPAAASGPRDLPEGVVRVEIFEHPADAPSKAKGDPGSDPSWTAIPNLKTDEWEEPVFGFAAITNKYTPTGVKADRSSPFLIRATGRVVLAPGNHRILLRAIGGARLIVDGQPIAITDAGKRKGGDVEAVPDQAAAQLVPELRLLPPGHRETLATLLGDGRPHTIVLEAFVGGKGIRPDLGELSASISMNGAPFRFLSPNHAKAPDLTESGWRVFAQEQESRIAKLNATRRRNADEEAYWKTRHALARTHAPQSPEVPMSESGGNAIDSFVGVKLREAGIEPAPVIDDAAFLRRVSLDAIGVVPTGAEFAAFLADEGADKREQVVDRLLQDSRWADRWVPYWQDVLAENPNVLKGTLNNTGPFRWWLHEALLDNKPADRFATELIAMDGSAHYGGPAGFALATQNDLPLAAKAQIISSAFLAKEMKCARCHDAPNHPFNQEELFNLAAMLQRGPFKVPGSSLTKGLGTNSHVTVSLEAGQPIEPHWPFADGPTEPLPGVLRRANDSRERLAALITDPRNERFAQVLVNRLWREFFGFGIVDPVDDWENSAPSHPALLAWLGRELVTHDYDLKHVARLILTSKAYQRAATPAGSRAVKSDERFFEATARRRMTAEQLVDSLALISRKEFAPEMLTMDPEGRQSANDHGNLGIPQRAWQFAALSNERDRPALAKPRAQIVTDVLATFGWRESRAEPKSTRDHDANVLQPALLANGLFGTRVVRLCDESAFTAVALEPISVSELIHRAFARTLSRTPTSAELRTFTDLLAPGYEERRTGAAPQVRKRGITKAVSWANHLNPDATNVVLGIEQEVKAGDLPSPRLRADWRERMEDMLWALLVSPEFVYLP